MSTTRKRRRNTTGERKSGRAYVLLTCSSLEYTHIVSALSYFSVFADLRGRGQNARCGLPRRDGQRQRRVRHQQETSGGDLVQQRTLSEMELWRMGRREFCSFSGGDCESSISRGLFQCDKPCGGGVYHRLVRCQDHLGQPVPDVRCEFSSRPHNSKECNSRPCKRYPKYLWKRTDWSTVRCSYFCRGRRMSSHVVYFPSVLKVLRPRHRFPPRAVRRSDAWRKGRSGPALSDHQREAANRKKGRGKKEEATAEAQD